jgi:photosystem II stability/assembly factor-like uncharacterized protein
MRFRLSLIIACLFVAALVVGVIVFRPGDLARTEGILAPTPTPTPAPAPTSVVSITPTGAPSTRTDATPTPPDLNTTTSQITTLAFVDAQHGWLIQTECPAKGKCTETLRATTDGGQTWPMSWPAPNVDPGSMTFFTTKDGWNYGTNGWYGTHDGGATWTPGPGDSVDSMVQMGQTLWAAQRQCTKVGTFDCPLRLLTSTDMGRTWVPAQPQPTLSGVANFHTIGDHDAWIATNLDPYQTNVGTLITTHDGGQSWQTRTYPCQSPDIFPELEVVPGQLWITCMGYPGTGQSDQDKTLYRSTDDGQQWESIAHHDYDATQEAGPGPDPKPGYLPGPALWGIALQAPDKPWFIVAQGYLVRGVDGGHTWHYLDLPYEQVTPGGAGLGPITFLDERTGWVAGHAGLLRTTDGGEHWEAIPIR